MLFHITIKKLLQESNKWKHIFDNYLTKKKFKTVFTILLYLYTNKYAADSRWQT